MISLRWNLIVQEEAFFFSGKKISTSQFSHPQKTIYTMINYKGDTFHTTSVYGEPDHKKRQEVWDEISRLQLTTTGPWFLTGDFNEIIDNSKKCGGPARAEGTLCAFRTFLSQNGLFDLKFSGSYLSWRGKRHTHLASVVLTWL